MADWKIQYLSSLKARNEVERADQALYNRCTKLADRNVELKEQLRASRESTKTDITPASVPAPLLGYGFRRQQSLPPADNESTAQLRQDFAQSQRERALLQGQVDELKKEVDAISTRSAKDVKKVIRLNETVTQLTVKLKDREEELRGKAKLLENVQDENATLNLELGQADQEVKRVKKENQELVDRWVARMGKEADKMNLDSKFS